MSPVVTMILIKLLTVVACQHNDGIIHKSLFLQGLKHLAQQQVVLITGIAIQVPERSWVHIVVKLGIVGKRPCWLEMLVLVGRQFKTMGQIEEKEREERLFLILSSFHIGNKHIGHSRITLQGSLALGLGMYAAHTSKDNSSKRRVCPCGAGISLNVVAQGLQSADKQRLDMSRLKTLPIIARQAKEEAEHTTSRTIAATHMIGKPLILFGKLIGMRHTFWSKCPAIP